MKDFYTQNKDYKDFIDRNAKTYGKTVEFMKLTPTAKEYERYIKERDKIKGINYDNSADADI